MKFSNPWGRPAFTTHLGIELVHTSDCLLNPSVFNGLSDLHALLYHVLINRGRDAGFSGKFNSCIRKALEHEVVKDEGIEITVLVSARKIDRNGCNRVQRCKYKGCPQMC